MVKKTTTLIMAFLMLFSLAGCRNNALMRYKKAGTRLIDAHAATKAENDYSEANWVEVLGAVVDGKVEVDAAKSKAGVDAAVDAAKKAIDNVPNKDDVANLALAQYKDEAKGLIDAHLQAKVQGDYSEANWATIQRAAADGKAGVNTAIDKTGVDTAVNIAKEVIDDVPKNKYVGVIYDLQEAYDNGFLTKENIMHIAYFCCTWFYVDGEYVDSFDLQIRRPEINDLDLQTVNDIKTAYYEFNKEYIDENFDWYYDDSDYDYQEGDLKTDAIELVSFYGEYGGFYAVRPECVFLDYPDVTDSYEVNVAGVKWNQSRSPIMIFVYQDFAQCKTTQKGLIDSYAATKTQSDYKAADWTLICDAVALGNTAVDKAGDTVGVYAAVKNAKKKINMVLKKDAVLQKKEIWNGTIDEKFEDDVIYVEIDKNFNSIKFSAEDFAAGNMLSISRVFLVYYGGAGYRIEIKNKGKQNVINAIRELEKLDFVRSAYPSYYDYFDTYGNLADCSA